MMDNQYFLSFSLLLIKFANLIGIKKYIISQELRLLHILEVMIILKIIFEAM